MIKWNTEPPPDKETDYLVTTNYGDLEIASWHEYPVPSKWRWAGYPKWGAYPIAWIELPEPYKAEPKCWSCKNLYHNIKNDAGEVHDLWCDKLKILLERGDFSCADFEEAKPDEN